ncbi:MAG: hypothetical protein WAS07_00085 [Micropruina sp.]|nr:hypothetical protein [Micropruina sp.]
MTSTLFALIGFVLSPPKRDERGLSQSTENAILLAGAVTIAIIVISAVTLYVTSKLPTP